MKQVTLSRRNLLYLLTSLEQGNKKPYFIPPAGPIIAAESDADHYRGRERGSISPGTLQVMAEIEMCLSFRRALRDLK